MVEERRVIVQDTGLCDDGHVTDGKTLSKITDQVRICIKKIVFFEESVESKRVIRGDDLGEEVGVRMGEGIKRRAPCDRSKKAWVWQSQGCGSLGEIILDDWGSDDMTRTEPGGDLRRRSRRGSGDIWENRACWRSWRGCR
jgi:hypothetical protein